MIAVILSWLLLSIVFISFGDMAVGVWNKITKRKDSYSTTEKFWIGICFIGTFLLYISIFLAINQWVFYTLAILAIIYLLLNKAVTNGLLEKLRNKIKESKPSERLIFAFALLAILLFPLSTPLIYDEGLYHLQTMQWSEKYRAILGLGNIHGRLGFNSSFLLLSTTFDYAPLKDFLFFSINSLCLLVFCMWLVRKIGESETVIHTSAFSIILLTSLFSLGTNISSTSTDILPNIFIMYLLIRISMEENIINRSPLIFILLPAFCITLKLSSAIIVLLAIVALLVLFKKGEKRSAVAGFTLCLLIALPWLARFVIMTGYLVYPFPAIDLFAVNWKIPLDLVMEEKDLAYAWARVPNMEAKDVLAMGFMEWIPLWAERLSAYNLLIYVLAIISPLFILTWRAKRITPWFIAYLGVLFGIFTAPDFRFGFGFLMAALVIPFLLPGKQKKFNPYKNTTTSLVKIGLAIGLIGIIYIAFNQIRTYQSLSHDSAISLLYKPQDINLLQRELDFKEYKVNNTTIFVPQGTNQCFNQQIPCAPYYNVNLDIRGSEIQDGFKNKSLDN